MPKGDVVPVYAVNRVFSLVSGFALCWCAFCVARLDDGAQQGVAGQKQGGAHQETRSGLTVSLAVAGVVE